MLTKLVQSAADDVHLLEIIGRVDNNSTERLSNAVHKALLRDRVYVLLDMHGVEFINSAGLRTLVQLYKQIVRREGTLILINPSENVQKLLELVGLDTVFEIHHDARWNAGAFAPGMLPEGNREVCYCL